MVGRGFEPGAAHPGADSARANPDFKEGFEDMMDMLDIVSGGVLIARTGRVCYSPEESHHESMTESEQNRERVEDRRRRSAMFSERVVQVAQGDESYLRAWEELRALLLEAGESWEVVPPFEREVLLGDLIRVGKLYEITHISYLPGEPNRCHDNVAAVLEICGGMEGAPNLLGATGYALSEDGLWRQHSWAVGDEGEIFETTVGRTAYFGVSIVTGDRGRE